MSHGRIALLDSTLRTNWFGQGKFALSKALFSSTKHNRVYQQKLF